MAADYRKNISVPGDRLTELCYENRCAARTAVAGRAVMMTYTRSSFLQGNRAAVTATQVRLVVLFIFSFFRFQTSAHRLVGDLLEDGNVGGCQSGRYERIADDAMAE